MKIKEALTKGVDIIKTILTEAEVDPRIQEERKKICRDCDFSTLNNRRCSLCGCWLPIKRKYLKYNCPDNPPKW